MCQDPTSTRKALAVDAEEADDGTSATASNLRDLETVDRLLQQFEGVHSFETVVRGVERSRTLLVAAGTVADLGNQTEAMARCMLSHPASTHLSRRSRGPGSGA